MANIQDVPDSYIHLINRVRGPYGSLWPHNFLPVLWPKREARGPQNGEKNREAIISRMVEANEVNKGLITWSNFSPEKHRRLHGRV